MVVWFIFEKLCHYYGYYVCVISSGKLYHEHQSRVKPGLGVFKPEVCFPVKTQYRGMVSSL